MILDKGNHPQDVSGYFLDNSLLTPVATVPGDDQTTCIKTAIEKASCGVQLDFVNGGCYKKKGSFKVPYHIEM